MTMPINDQPLEVLLGRSPSADLVGSALHAALVQEQAKADPFGEFADLQPITIRNAGLVLREATKRLEAAKLVHKNQTAALHEATQEYSSAIDAHRKAEHLLKISALQPNGGEA